MGEYSEVAWYLVAEPKGYLQRLAARLQPILAAEGMPNVDHARLRRELRGFCALEEMIVVQSPEHWDVSIRGLGEHIDAILPLSIPDYPTEVWNSHPQPLVDRGLPVIFWSLVDHEEPDFWRWSACDLLRTLGVDVHLVQNNREGAALLKALAMKRCLKRAKIVVFGEQNFPWNAYAVGDRVTQNLGTEIVVRPLADIRARYEEISAALAISSSGVGALTDHFGDSLSPDDRYERALWRNLARFAHCGFVGVVSPEMTSRNTVALNDWGGTTKSSGTGAGAGLMVIWCQTRSSPPLSFISTHNAC